MAQNDSRWRGRQTQDGPVLDMLPDGSFAAPARAPSAVTIKVFGVAVVVAVLAGVGAIALLALWLALQLIPIAIGAGLVAYGLFRYRLWRSRRDGTGLFGGQRNIYRP